LQTAALIWIPITVIIVVVNLFLIVPAVIVRMLQAEKDML
jgi:hypothetical protein